MPILPARVAYDVPRQRVWGGKVSSYIWTKSIAAGLGLLAALDVITGTAAGALLSPLVLPVLAMVFLAATGVLLIADLKRPERFWKVLALAQWKSWLARGALVITGYAALLGGWTLAVLMDAPGALELLAWPLALFALLTAVYTAFLFAQCEGRDLWQSPLLLVSLALEAPLAGLAVVLVLSGGLRHAGAWELISQTALLLVLFALVALADGLGRHTTPNARAAAKAMVKGRYARLFWASLVIGVAAPLAFMMGVGAPALPVAGLLILAGMWMHGHAFVLAGQGPPIS